VGLGELLLIIEALAFPYRLGALRRDLILGDILVEIVTRLSSGGDAVFLMALLSFFPFNTNRFFDLLARPHNHFYPK